MNDEAIAALEAYGYKLVGDRYRKPGKRSQEWQSVDGGFFRFDPIAGGSEQMPMRVLDDDELAVVNIDRAKNGIRPLLAHEHNYREEWQHDMFVWLWPAEEVQRIYEAGIAGRTADPSPPEE